MRLFVSINPDGDTKRELANKADEFLSGLNHTQTTFIRQERTEKLHLTLFFIGEVSEQRIDDIENALAIALHKDNTGIQLFTDQIGFLPNPVHPRVIFFNLGGDLKKLFGLHEKITREFNGIGIKQEKKFLPHITFARCKNKELKFTKTANHNLKFRIEFFAEKISLMKSILNQSGAVHTEIAAWKI